MRKIVAIDYLLKDGSCVFTVSPVGRFAVLMKLSEDGEIAEIYQAKDFVKDGPCFVLKAGKLVSMQQYEFDVLKSERMIEVATEEMLKTD